MDNCFPKHREFENEYSFSKNIFYKIAKTHQKNTIIQYIYKYDPTQKRKLMLSLSWQSNLNSLLFLEAHKEISFNITKCNVSKYLLETKLKFEIVPKKKPHQWWRCNLTKIHHNYKSKGIKPLQDEPSNRTKPQSKDDWIFGVKSSKLWLWLEQKYKEQIMNSKTQLS